MFYIIVVEPVEDSHDYNQEVDNEEETIQPTSMYHVVLIIQM